MSYRSEAVDVLRELLAGVGLEETSEGGKGWQMNLNCLKCLTRECEFYSKYNGEASRGFKKFVLIGGTLLHNVVLVSASQRTAATCIHVSPPL